MEALKQNCNALEHIKVQTEEMCIYAINNGLTTIEFIKNENLLKTFN